MRLYARIGGLSLLPPVGVEPRANANCYPAHGPDEVVVGSMAALEAVANGAIPGRHVLIAPGSYGGGGLTFTARGAEGAPIVVRPRDGPGTVTINNAGWILANTSSRLVLAHLNFSGGNIKVNGNHNRVTRCLFRDYQIALSLITSRNGRIDHCDFSGMRDNASPRYCIYLDPNGFATRTNIRNLIDHCYFHDINTVIMPPGAELIRMHGQAANYDLDEDVCTIERCLFQNISIMGENEIIGIKSGGFRVRFCTFEACANTWLSIRQGSHNEIRSCWFERISSTSLRGALSVKGNDHLIIGNRLVGDANIIVWAGNTTVESEMAGTAPKPPHARANGCRFVGNVLDKGYIQIAAYTGITPVAPASNNNVSVNDPGANKRLAGGDPYIIANPKWATGTMFKLDPEPFTPATKLLPSEVGPVAPDPFCQP